MKKTSILISIIVVLFGVIVFSILNKKEENTEQRAELESQEFELELKNQKLYPTNEDVELAKHNMKNRQVEPMTAFNLKTNEKEVFKLKEKGYEMIQVVSTGCGGCQNIQPEVQKFMDEHSNIHLIQIYPYDDEKSTTDFNKAFGDLTKNSNVQMYYDDPSPTSTSFDLQKFMELHQVMYTPTFLLYKNGEFVFGSIGNISTIQAYLDLKK